MAEIRHLENRHDVIFFCRGWSDLDKISEIGAEWHVDCDDVVEIETRCRIPIWRTFGRIQWHVIPEPPVTCHIAGCSHLTKLMSSSFHIAGCKSPPYWKSFFAIFYFLLLLMQLRLWRAAAFVSSPIHLFRLRELNFSAMFSNHCLGTWAVYIKILKKIKGFWMIVQVKSKRIWTRSSAVAARDREMRRIIDYFVKSLEVIGDDNLEYRRVSCLSSY